jgi:hypothetical protein
MKAEGFTFCAVDAAVARLKIQGQWVWVLIFVDDVLIASKYRHAVNKVKKLLLSIYPGTDKGKLRSFLGRTVHREAGHRRRSISLCKKACGTRGFDRDKTEVDSM